MAETVSDFIVKRLREWGIQRIYGYLHNNDLNQVTWEQRIMTGDPKNEASQDLPDFPYARYAESLGLKGIRVDDPDGVADAWDQAMKADRPCVVEAMTDPDTPTLPPHITFKQARSFAAALLEGDPREGGIITQAVKGVVEGILPH